ncbi:hypothetical protein [Alysiella filiformis]|nr:hypothetical protein [Alysiella filiformis]QMT30632.1 hypothetical protein H3L97_07695 [Alysiella filiformis]
MFNKTSLQFSPIGIESWFVGKLTVTYPKFTLNKDKQPHKSTFQAA